MRILLTSTRDAGHVAPLIPFALACRRAGHEVLLAAPRSAWEHVARAGLPFAGVDEHAALPGMLALVRRWRPHVVLRESCEHAGRLAAESCGVPVVPVACGLGAQPADRYFTLAPRSLDGAHPGAVRFRLPVAPAEPLPAWWGRSRAPLVYVALGDEGYPERHREAAQRLGELDVRVLMTLGTDVDPAALGPVPANVHVERWVAQERVMPHTAAMVGDGGASSTLLALAYAVPLAIVPGERATARRVAELGAGLMLNGVGHLDSAIRGLLDNPAFWLAAGRVSTEMAGQRELATVLREFTGNQRLAA
jgi:UDP:flavonoid glycosyltransferase YjiC (YdhE family)